MKRKAHQNQFLLKDKLQNKKIKNLGRDIMRLIVHLKI